MAKLPYVEDNEINRDMLSRRLQRRGYEVLITVDGEQGIAQATAEKPDLILMDMSLPVVDGWEATRRLKGAPEARGIPIIGLTAHAWPPTGTSASRRAATTTTPSRSSSDGLSTRSRVCSGPARPRADERARASASGASRQHAPGAVGAGDRSGRLRGDADREGAWPWILWPSRDVRDKGMKKVMADPRMQPDKNSMPFDGKRMIYGGFEMIVEL